MIFESYTRTGMLLTVGCRFGRGVWVCIERSSLLHLPQPHRIGLDSRSGRMGDATFPISQRPRRRQAPIPPPTAVLNRQNPRPRNLPVHHAVPTIIITRNRQAATVAAAPDSDAASASPSGATAEPGDRRFQGWAFKCSRAEFQPGQYSGANPTSDRPGDRWPKSRSTIYGQYGPGSISATLSSLLDGSGYDFVIVGGGE